MTSVETSINKSNWKRRSWKKIIPKIVHKNKIEDVQLAIPLSNETVTKEDGTCLLCLQIPKEWYHIGVCGCQFCRQCMEEYAHCSVMSGNVPVTCPSGNCRLVPVGNSSLTFEEIENLVPSLVPLFEKVLKNREVADNPNLIWCPQPDCETVCSVKRSRKKSFRRLFRFLSISSQKRKKDFVTCLTCDFIFCIRCKSSWQQHQSNCPDTKSIRSPDLDIEADSLSVLLEDNPVIILEHQGHIKRCPFCKVPIERDDGCAQIMCLNCRHIFCWFCLRSLDNDFMLRHYDSGPCRNLLGHSRMSVIWHRTQVVATFLGIGILCLVNSPFILLCCPCFFIWRHQQNLNSKSPDPLS